MQRGDIMELNFEGIEMLKMKYNNGENPDREWERCGYLSNYYYVYFES